MQDRKWIKIDDPNVNTFWNVLKQILTYVEIETSLKLTIEDIDKEQKPKSGTIEVNTTQNTTGKKSAEVNSVASSKGQTTNSGNNQGNKQISNTNANIQYHYCKNIRMQEEKMGRGKQYKA